MGLEYAGLAQTRYNNPIKGFFRTLFSVLKFPWSLHRRDIVVVQYPFKRYFKLICRLAHLRRAKVLTVVHSLGCPSRKRLAIKREIRRLNHSDYIIAHNQVMAKWLYDNGCHVKISSLGIFDYLSRSKPKDQPANFKPFEIIYAGALYNRKYSGFYDWLNTLTPANNIHLTLYGKGFNANALADKAPVDYKGNIPPEEIISSAVAHFGLAWDGDTAENYSDAYAEYLRLCNPHKASLYLRCGIPVIVWKESAVQHIINDFHAGIAIESLSELPALLAKMTEDEYQQLREGAARLGTLIAQGHFIQQALLGFRFRFGSDGRHYV